jgi:hypothetical protein
MGLLDKIKNAFGKKEDNSDTPEKEFEKLVYKTWQEYKTNRKYFWNANLNETETWTIEVKNWPDKKKISFIIWLVSIIHQKMHDKPGYSTSDEEYQRDTIRQAFIQSLFRNKLIMEDMDVENIYNAFSKHRRNDWSSFTGWPIGPMLNQLENQRKNQLITPVLRVVLQNIKRDISAVQSSYDEKERIKMMDKIDAILFIKQDNSTDIKHARFLGDDPFAEFANPIIEKMAQTDRLFWYRLLPIAQKATGSKPSEKYLNDTKVIINELGSDNFKQTIHEWFQFLINLKERETLKYYSGSTFNYTYYEYITPVNAEAVKGLIWACAHFHDKATIQIISVLAERAFRKIPGQGASAASLGNACFYVLYKSKGLDGIGQLSRLKLRIKQSSAQELIDNYLKAAAEKKGITVNEIEDMVVNDFGMANGFKSFAIDEFTAELTITGVGKTEIKWLKDNGTSQKSVPAIIKEKNAAKLKIIKDTVKQVEQTLTAQRDRLDRLFRYDHKIGWSNFEQYYLNHGLMSYLANGLIWNLYHSQGQITQAIHLNNYWVNAANEIVPIADTEAVSLWHPVQAKVAEIAAWRDFFAFHTFQQPLKQAYREVYLLTDAEVNTKSYSNRMAAHILRQHQFNSLTKVRGWRYALMGAFDNGRDNNKASLILPGHNLRAEYWISEVAADGAMNDTGIWNYVSTDQIRFINTTSNETIDLVDIPQVVFSEVMRDADLFVGVASVGNDPTWRDSGGLTAYRDYWTSYSFGELSEFAKSRKEILGNLVPRLKIKDVAYIKDKFLVVKGKLRTYKIHLGSTNILMEPNDQYLCIVQDRTQKNHTENVFLPFEGDTGLSIILSKAFLLADDDKITDSTILSQINRK